MSQNTNIPSIDEAIVEPLVPVYIRQSAVLVPYIVAQEIQRLKDLVAALAEQAAKR